MRRFAGSLPFFLLLPASLLGSPVVLADPLPVTGTGEDGIQPAVPSLPSAVHYDAQRIVIGNAIAQLMQQKLPGPVAPAGDAQPIVQADVVEPPSFPHPLTSMERQVTVLPPLPNLSPAPASQPVPPNNIVVAASNGADKDIPVDAPQVTTPVAETKAVNAEGAPPLPAVQTPPPQPALAATPSVSTSQVLKAPSEPTPDLAKVAPPDTDFLPRSDKEPAATTSEVEKVWSQHLETLERENQVLRAKVQLGVADPLADIKVDAVAQTHEEVLRARISELETELDKRSMKPDADLPEKTKPDVPAPKKHTKKSKTATPVAQ